ncbi:hypothetical protein SKAU_G00414010 [Synaphobranchus kaupii]|uniref:DDE Tnp4 domain-containing protein n=1 Tax=Synaphobranchus kaupii TaxID=118154 RepID=A0A9Q1E6Y6_SYNKA|nr:hypothetical protein SKAU_G00414010 [Synaphobranchus kaupii]
MHDWSHEMEIFLLLYWLACGASYRVVADKFSIPLPTVCRSVHRMIELLLGILHRFIHFLRFAQQSGHVAFRHAVGAIDGCHIRIRPSAEPQKMSYMNRKLFPSIILQGICDSKGHFLKTYIGQKGLRPLLCWGRRGREHNSTSSGPNVCRYHQRRTDGVLASIKLYHCQVAAVTPPPSAPFPVGGSLRS